MAARALWDAGIATAIQVPIIVSIMRPNQPWRPEWRARDPSDPTNRTPSEGIKASPVPKHQGKTPGREAAP